MLCLLVSSAVGDLNITALWTTSAEVLRGVTRLFSPFLWTNKRKPTMKHKKTTCANKKKKWEKERAPCPLLERKKTRVSQRARASLLLFPQTAASDGSPQDDSRVAGREIISTSTPQPLECGLSCSDLLRTETPTTSHPPRPHLTKTHSTPSQTTPMDDESQQTKTSSSSRWKAETSAKGVLHFLQA